MSTAAITGNFASEQIATKTNIDIDALSCAKGVIVVRKKHVKEVRIIIFWLKFLDKFFKQICRSTKDFRGLSLCFTRDIYGSDSCL